MHPLVIVMGVSGVGKSTVGSALAERLGVPFVDADDLHTAASIEKMRSGSPLTDEDRWPWLAAVGDTLAAAEATGMVLACSALKRAHRDVIRAREHRAFFVYLSGSVELITSRMRARLGHFAPLSMLASQFAALEPLEADEPGVEVDVTPPLAAVVDDAAVAIVAL